jgi:hypothetical protein
MDSYTLTNKNQKHRAVKPNPEDYLEYGRYKHLGNSSMNRKEESSDSGYGKLCSFSSSMIPNNLVYHVKHLNEIQKEKYTSKSENGHKAMQYSIEDFEA